MSLCHLCSLDDDRTAFNLKKKIRINTLQKKIIRTKKNVRKNNTLQKGTRKF